MRLSSALTAFALLASASLVAACSGGGGTQLEYAPPVNYNPRAGLTSDLTNANALPGPSAPPFNPW